MSDLGDREIARLITHGVGRSLTANSVQNIVGRVRSLAPMLGSIERIAVAMKARKGTRRHGLICKAFEYLGQDMTPSTGLAHYRQFVQWAINDYWQRGDLKKASEIARSFGFPDPSEHELDDLRREPVAITSADCEESL